MIRSAVGPECSVMGCTKRHRHAGPHDYREGWVKAHKFEIEPRGASGAPMYLMVDGSVSEGRAVTRAVAYLEELHDGVDHVAIYHTYPSPGPVRRYVGTVHRGEHHVRRPS